MIERPLDLLYSKLSIVIGLGYILLPVMVLSVCSVLQTVDRSLIEAARDLGARPSRAVRGDDLPSEPARASSRARSSSLR